MKVGGKEQQAEGPQGDPEQLEECSAPDRPDPIIN